MVHKSWQKATPTEPGFYWLYIKEAGKWNLRIAEVWAVRQGQSSQGVAYVCENEFIYPEDAGFSGQWLKIEQPALPIEE